MGYVSDLFSLDQIQKDPDAHGPLLLREKRNGGKQRGDIFSCVDPVDAHDGNLLRHPDPLLLKAPDQAQGKFIVEAHDGGGIQLPFQKKPGRQLSLSEIILVHQVDVFLHLFPEG